VENLGKIICSSVSVEHLDVCRSMNNVKTKSVEYVSHDFRDDYGYDIFIRVTNFIAVI